MRRTHVVFSGELFAGPLPKIFPDLTSMKPSSSRLRCHRLQAERTPGSAPNGRSNSRPVVRLLFPATPQTAIKLTRKPSIFSRNDPYPTRSKSPLIIPFDLLPNTIDFCFKLSAKPLVFIPEIRPISSQSAAKAWPPSFLAPCSTSPRPPSAVPSPEGLQSKP